MRRLTIDAGNGEDHQQISHSNPNGATAPSSHMLNGYHQHQHHNKQFFKSKTSHVVDMLLPSSSSSSPPVPVLHHKRRLKKGPIHQQTSKNETTTGSAATSTPTSEFLTLTCAIGLWYALGVVSIATSKLLLLPSTTTATGTDFRRVHLSPLALTLQQLWIGSTLLKCWFYYAGRRQRRRRRRNSKAAAAAATSGLQVWPRPVVVAPSSSLSPEEHKNTDHDNLSTSTLTTHRTTTCAASPEQILRWTAICFALGFLATNFAFSGSAASFVETVKAAEPITSATVAVVYGLETLTGPQQASLGTIVAGVLLATLGDSSSSNSSNDLPAGHTLAATLLSSAIVMTSNLCFSFRGLYQKLLRRVASTQVLDDWNLQYRMQCTGVWLLVVPVLLLDFLPTILYGERPTWSTTLPENGRSFGHYILLASINGTAFCSYNLASTYLLTRLTVVSHAALNCLRRVFAIVVTSLLFDVPLTVTKWAGMGLAMMGFGLYTYYKMEQQQQEQQQLQQYQRRRHRSQGSVGSHGSSASSSRWSPSRPKTPQQQHSFPLNGKYHHV